MCRGSRRTITTARPTRITTRPGVNARDRRGVRTFDRGRVGRDGVSRFQPRFDRVITRDCPATRAEMSTSARAASAWPCGAGSGKEVMDEVVGGDAVTPWTCCEEICGDFLLDRQQALLHSPTLS